MSTLIKPQGYKAILDTKQTEQGIKLIKEFFQQNLSTELRLRRVTAPLFVWMVRVSSATCTPLAPMRILTTSTRCT